jgi:MFS family permease
MGNSLLQSGTSIGAILTPLILSWLLTEELGSWRFAFQVVGAVGALWVVAWIPIAPATMAAPSAKQGPASAWWRVLCDRRMLVILAVVALINTTFQLFRAWLPKFLQEGRGYSESETLYFTSLWFVATDIGCLGAGAIAVWLARKGLSVRRARLATFSLCAILCLATLAIPWLPHGWLLLTALLISGAGALGVFPLYHAFTQDVSHEHQGKITGIAGVAAWAFSPVAHRLFGRYIDQHHSFDLGLAAAGCLPLAAFVMLAMFWPRGGPGEGEVNLH